MDVLLSIKPHFARAILNGEKRYEYRKSIFRQHPINRVYLYASSPVQKIVGWFEIDDILEGEPAQVWEMIKDDAGISEASFLSYFGERSKAYAIRVGNRREFTTPLDPRVAIPGFVAPQSFCYPDCPLPIE